MMTRKNVETCRSVITQKGCCNVYFYKSKCAFVDYNKKLEKSYLNLFSPALL